jgi:hypothetical protein
LELFADGHLFAACTLLVWCDLILDWLSSVAVMPVSEELGAFTQRLLIVDSVSAIDAFGLVSDEQHGSGAGNASAFEIPDSRASEVVRDAMR